MREKEKTARNREILAEWKAGKTYREIGAKFGLSTTRVYTIVARMREKEKSDNVDAFDREDFDGEDGCDGW